MGHGTNSKPGSPSVISAATFQQLSQKVEKLEKQVEETLLEKNQWNAVVRGWIGFNVCICLVNGQTVVGKLEWTDRYTMCLQSAVYLPSSLDPYKTDKEPDVSELIVHKGAIVSIHKTL